jgi:hypothetical protein
MEGLHFQVEGGLDEIFASNLKDTHIHLDSLGERFELGRVGLLSSRRGTNCKFDTGGPLNEGVVGKVEFDLLKLLNTQKRSA